MNGFLNDLRFGLRQLASQHGFATAAILTLALGIGANTAVFSVLSGYLFKPLPYPHGDELVQVVSRIPKLRAEPRPTVSLPLYQAIKEQTNAFAATASYLSGTSSVIAAGRARYVASVHSTASLFDVLGVKPLLGRTFDAGNLHAGNDNVALISYALWRNSFGANPDVIGETVKLDDGMRRIIGVMPRGFTFPNRDTALWMPLTIMPQMLSSQNALNLNMQFVGRLNPGVSLDGAQVQAQHAVSLYLRDKAPTNLQKLARDSEFSMGVRSWRSALLGDRPATLWLLQGAVVLILLMTCVNVANLLLSRLLGRSREVAIRSALGATRRALARQLLGEALCLTVPGGFIGVALAWLVLYLMSGASLSTGDAIFSVSLDWRVGLFALGAVLATAGLVSLLPIRHLAKTDLQLVLQESGRTGGGGRGTRRTRNALVIAELTLATGLLAMAGLLLHSFMNLENVDPGFRKTHVLMAGLLVPRQDHPGNKALNSFYASLRQRVETLPGVRQAAMARILPLAGGQRNASLPVTAFTIAGRQPTGKPPAAMINAVSPGYFKALGIPILRGRSFDPRDARKPTAIVDAELAKKYFSNANPIGQQLDINGTKYTIVGVAPPVKYAELSTSSTSTTIYTNDAYVTDTRGPSRATTLVIHTAISPDALVKPLKNLVASVDPNVAVYDIRTMHNQVSASLTDKQTTMTLLLAFGAIALALAIVGIYAVMSYAVAQRRTECGVRLALGALPEDLLWLVLRDGLKLLAVGLAVGLGLAVLFGYLLSAQLFDVAPFDPITLTGSAVVLCAITLIACWLPARRAAKLDPAIAMTEQ